MKVLLINPPIRTNDKPRHLPIGLGIIASVLLENAHEVEILDINAERLNAEEVLDRIKFKDKYDLIGIGGLITTYKYLRWLIPNIKMENPRTKIVIGGGVVSERPNLLLSNTPSDFAIIGEGEYTILELIDAIENKKNFENIKGLAFKNGKDIIINSPRELIKDLDSLPFPAYDLFPIDVYLKNVSHGLIIEKKSEMSIITSRGCPYNCNYCYHIFGQGARSRSVNKIIEHIKLLKRKYNIQSIIFLDETFTINKKKVLEFCDKMIAEKINIPWSCYGRVNLVEFKMLKKMKKAGCYRIGYGIESGSQKILDNMNKKVKVEQAKKAIKLTRKAHILAGSTFMFGYLGEDINTIRETVAFCKELLIQPSFFYTTPYPGTDLYQKSYDKIIEKYGTEENFIDVLGDALDFTINLTNFSDTKLKELKKNAEQQCRNISFLDRLRMIYLIYKQLGLYLVIKYILKKIKRYL